MRRIKWIPGIFLAMLLLCLTGCKEEDAPDTAQEETLPVDEKAKPLVIEAKSPSETEQEQSEQQENDTRQKTEKQTADNQKPDEAQQENTESASFVWEELNAQIASMISGEQAKGTTVSVYAEDLTTGRNASVGNQKQQSASLIKLFIAGCVYEHLSEVKTQESYGNETDDLIRQMITVSDNDAANALVKRLGSGDANAGMALVNDYCSRNGFSDTHMGRLMLDFNAADDNYTSVNDCGRFLEAVYQNKLTGSENILAYLKQQERTGKIPAGVPAGVETANKTGELTDVENDAAIIFKEHTPYVLCIITNRLPDPAAGRALITSLSASVYEYMGSES